MELYRSSYVIFLISYLIITIDKTFLGVNSEVNEVSLTIRGAKSIAKTDENFLCATLDWWPPDKCDYGQCPWGRAGILSLDVTNEILNNAVKALSPLRLRIGGSLQDQVFYNVGRRGGQCQQTQFYKTNEGRFGFSECCLSMQRWDELAHFLNDNGALIIFGLNALNGKIKLENDDLYVGDWNDQNAREFMQYNIFKGHKIDAYELGNELCVKGVSGRIDARQYGKDMKILKQVVKTLYTDPKTQPKVLGPGGFYEEQWFTTFLQESGPNVVDGLTHHIYNLGVGADKNLTHKIQDPDYLSLVAQTYKNVAEVVYHYGAWSQAWVGEAGGAFMSGGKDVADTFANGFWYLDQLGMTSTLNHKVFCRQSLIGGNYGLLNTDTFIPNPDYYGTLLWHRLMGTNVLATTHTGSPFLRAYSHCSKTKPGISVLFINMSNTTTFNVLLANDHNMSPEPRMTNTEREEYHLTPKDGNIQGNEVLLNGQILRLTATNDIPQMNPIFMNSTSPIKVAPQSFVFVTIRNFQAPACLSY